MSKPLRPASEYHEDMGDVMWWKFPVDESPYVGSPNDLGYAVSTTLMGPTGDQKSVEMYVGGWPGYHTHFQEIDVPEVE
jgi:hypothetical protein